MNIILISNQSVQAKKIVLTKVHLTALAGVFLIAVLLLALALNYFSLRYADRIESPALKTLLVSPQEERHQKMQARFDRLGVTAEAFNRELVTLRHDLHCAEHQYDGQHHKHGYK